ncbi:putative membrane-anchored protein [Bradyrhizobium embrapense]
MKLSLRDTATDERLGKVPAVTLGFWVIKILATTLGETGGDAVTMSMNLGYLVGTAIFAVVFAVAVAAQMAAKRFHPLLYWIVIIATTTVGTTFADFVDRSLGIGYLGGSSLLAGLLVASLVVWHRTMGTVSIASIDNRAAETFYWVTILFSQTLGTALGDWMADSTGLGYGGGAIVFAAGIAMVAAAYLWTRVSHTVLFWIAFVLTRPLGATVGDFLDKPLDHGGLALSRYTASIALAGAIAALVFILPQRAGKHA